MLTQWIAGPISNRIGRRDAIFFACLWWLLGTAFQAACNGIPMLICGRFINGIWYVDLAFLAFGFQANDTHEVLTHLVVLVSQVLKSLSTLPK